MTWNTTISNCNAIFRLYIYYLVELLVRIISIAAYCSMMRMKFSVRIPISQRLCRYTYNFWKFMYRIIFTQSITSFQYYSILITYKIQQLFIYFYKFYLAVLYLLIITPEIFFSLPGRHQFFSITVHTFTVPLAFLFSV